MLNQELLLEIAARACAEALQANSRALAEDVANRMGAALSGDQSGAILQATPAMRTTELRDGTALISETRTQTDTLEALLAASSALTPNCGLLVLRGALASGWNCIGFTAADNFKRATLDCSKGAAAQVIASCAGASSKASDFDPAFIKRLGIDNWNDILLVPVLLKGRVAALLIAVSTQEDDLAGLELLVQVAQLTLDLQAFRKGPAQQPAAQPQPPRRPAEPPRVAAPEPSSPAVPPPVHSTEPVASDPPVEAGQHREFAAISGPARAYSEPAPGQTVPPDVPSRAAHASVAQPAEYSYPTTSHRSAYSAQPALEPSPEPEAGMPAPSTAYSEASDVQPEPAPAASHALPAAEAAYSSASQPGPSRYSFSPVPVAPSPAPPSMRPSFSQPAPPVQDEAHDKARRFAKLLVEEIKLYNQAKVAEGRARGDLYSRLHDDIEKSRIAYQKRYGESVRDVDYFTQELLRILADNNLEVMGADFPS